MWCTAVACRMVNIYKTTSPAAHHSPSRSVARRSPPRRLRSRDQTHVASHSTPGCKRAGQEADFGAPPRHAGQANRSAEPRRRGQIRDPLRRRTAITSRSCSNPPAVTPASSAFRLRTHGGGLQQRPAATGPGHHSASWVSPVADRACGACVARATSSPGDLAMNGCRLIRAPPGRVVHRRTCRTPSPHAGALAVASAGTAATELAWRSVAPRKTCHFNDDKEIYIDMSLDNPRKNGAIHLHTAQFCWAIGPARRPGPVRHRTRSPDPKR